MDQEAFRSLLSAPRSAQAGPSRAVLGAPAPKRGWGGKSKDTYDKTIKKEEKPKPATEAFTPRNQLKKVGGKYQDRAEARRLGLEDEYKPVEQLLEDFEKRKAEAGDDAEKIEETRAYLGGDATHSILVKGLDYALLAARKAELEREKEGVADDELEAFAEDLSKGKKEKEKAKVEKVETKDEGLGNRFKSIALRKAEAEAAAAAVAGIKKKKKKKKVKVEPSSSATIPDEAVKTETSDIKSVVEQTSESKPPPLETTPDTKDEPVEEEEEEDIFGGVGEYKLEIEEDEDDDAAAENAENEDVKMDIDHEEDASRSDNDRREGVKPRERERSGSRDRHRPSRRSYSRSRSRSMSDSRSGYRRRRDYTPDDRDDRRRYDGRPRYDDRRDLDISRDYNDRRDGYGRRDDRSGDWRRDDRDRRDRDVRYRSRSRSRSRSPERERDRHYDRRTSYRSRSRSPRRRYLRSRTSSPRRSPSPPPSINPPKRARVISRSPTPPLLTGPPPRSPSLSASDSEDDQPALPGTRLQPLASSAISDLKGFLAADQVSAAAEEKRLRKAKWRAAQGLGVQEGVDLQKMSSMDESQKEKGEKKKLNRDYQMVMNVQKKREAEAKGE